MATVFDHIKLIMQEWEKKADAANKDSQTNKSPICRQKQQTRASVLRCCWEDLDRLLDQWEVNDES